MYRHNCLNKNESLSGGIDYDEKGGFTYGNGEFLTRLEPARCPACNMDLREEKEKQDKKQVGKSRQMLKSS